MVVCTCFPTKVLLHEVNQWKIFFTKFKVCFPHFPIWISVLSFHSRILYSFSCIILFQFSIIYYKSFATVFSFLASVTRWCEVYLYYCCKNLKLKLFGDICNNAFRNVQNISRWSKCTDTEKEWSIVTWTRTGTT